MSKEQKKNNRSHQVKNTYKEMEIIKNHMETLRAILKRRNSSEYVRYKLCNSGTLSVEGDWSNAAFFLAAKKLGSKLNVTGLCQNSPLGDRAVQKILEQLTNYCTGSPACLLSEQ